MLYVKRFLLLYYTWLCVFAISVTSWTGLWHWYKPALHKFDLLHYINLKYDFNIYNNLKLAPENDNDIWWIYIYIYIFIIKILPKLNGANLVNNIDSNKIVYTNKLQWKVTFVINTTSCYTTSYIFAVLENLPLLY